MDRAGLGYEALRVEKSDLIYVSLPAAGESGPLRDIVTYAPVIAALAGISSLVGYSSAREDFVGTLQVAFATRSELYTPSSPFWRRSGTARPQGRGRRSRSRSGKRRLPCWARAF